MRQSLLILALSLPFSMAAIGQDSTAVEGLLVLETNSLNAVVLVGDEAIGVASESPFLLSVGPKEITIVEAAAEAWLPRTAAGSVHIRPNETTSLRLDLPVRYRIDSLPPGAEIVLRAGGRDEVLGFTPLVVDRPAPIDGILAARHRGYVTAELAPGDSSFNRHAFILHPLEAGAVGDAATSWIPPREPRRWIDYAAAGVALAATGVAIYYKFEADAVDDRYRSPDSLERGDPLLKQEAERLDLYSLGALGVMQAGITVLAIRFILR